MTDDTYAVVGYDAGYVPCPDLAAADPTDEDDGDAVIGIDAGYVAQGDAAAAEPSPDDNAAAVVGYDAGYVANPCGGGACMCGLTDSFHRVVGATNCTNGFSQTGAYWGTADCGLTYSVLMENEGEIAVDGLEGLMILWQAPALDVTSEIAATLTPAGTVTADFLTQPAIVQFSFFGFPAGIDRLQLRFGAPHLVSGIAKLFIITSPAAEAAWGSGAIAWLSTPSSGTAIPSSFWQAGTTYTWTISSDGGSLTTTTITDGVTSYSTSLGGAAPTTITAVQLIAIRETLPLHDDATPWYVAWTSLNVPPVTACVTSVCSPASITQIFQRDGVETSRTDLLHGAGHPPPVMPLGEWNTGAETTGTGAHVYDHENRVFFLYAVGAFDPDAVAFRLQAVLHSETYLSASQWELWQGDLSWDMTGPIWGGGSIVATGGITAGADSLIDVTWTALEPRLTWFYFRNVSAAGDLLTPPDDYPADLISLVRGATVDLFDYGDPEHSLQGGDNRIHSSPYPASFTVTAISVCA